MLFLVWAAVASAIVVALYRHVRLEAARAAASREGPTARRLI